MEFAAILVRQGMTKNDALATACWLLHGVDTEKIWIERAERLDRFRQATLLARACADALTVFSRLAPHEAEFVDLDGEREDFVKAINRIDYLIMGPQKKTLESLPLAPPAFGNTPPKFETMFRDIAETAKQNPAWHGVDVREVYLKNLGKRFSDLADELKLEQARMRLIPDRQPRKRQTAIGLRLDALLNSARDAHVTAKSLATVAVDSPTLAHWCTDVAAELLKQDREDVIEKLRARLQKRIERQ